MERNRVRLNPACEPAESAAYKAALEEQQPYEQFARLVIRGRMRLGLTQHELAEGMGTSRSVVAQLEDGQSTSW